MGVGIIIIGIVLVILTISVFGPHEMAPWEIEEDGSQKGN